MQCQKCENTAVYNRKYSGESLCSECFSNSILRKAEKASDKNNAKDVVPIAAGGSKGPTMAFRPRQVGGKANKSTEDLEGMGFKRQKKL